MIHHAIWDFDGTLFDTYPVMVRAFRTALAQLDCPRLPEEADILAQMKQVTFMQSMDRLTKVRPTMRFILI